MRGRKPKAEITYPEGCIGKAGWITSTNSNTTGDWAIVEAFFACGGYKGGEEKKFWQGDLKYSRLDDDFYMQLAGIATVHVVSCHANCIFNTANAAPQDIGDMVPRPLSDGSDGQ